jgi:hypothetical protein
MLLQCAGKATVADEGLPKSLPPLFQDIFRT